MRARLKSIAALNESPTSAMRIVKEVINSDYPSLCEELYDALRGATFLLLGCGIWSELVGWHDMLLRARAMTAQSAYTEGGDERIGVLADLISQASRFDSLHSIRELSPCELAILACLKTEGGTRKSFDVIRKTTNLPPTTLLNILNVMAIRRLIKMSGWVRDSTDFTVELPK